MRFLKLDKHLSERVLAVDQSEELIKLGFDTKSHNSIMIWRKQLQDWSGEDISATTNYHLWFSSDSPVVMGFETFSEFPAYLDGELFEMLPKEFILDGNIWLLSLVCSNSEYFIEYSDTPLGKPIISVKGKDLLEVSYLAMIELLKLRKDE